MLGWDAGPGKATAALVSVRALITSRVHSVLWQVRVAALQNLVKIMSLYYQYMETYMGPALFAVSTWTSYIQSSELHLRCFVFLWEETFAYILDLFFSGSVCCQCLFPSKAPKSNAETPRCGAAQTVLGLLSSPAWGAGMARGGCPQELCRGT